MLSDKRSGETDYGGNGAFPFVSQAESCRSKQLYKANCRESSPAGKKMEEAISDTE